jgi:hypothetical protein
MTERRVYDGSRRHILDWTEAPNFLATVREWIASQGLTIETDAICVPSNRAQPSESRLFDADSPFLDNDRKDKIRQWWLTYDGNIPNWDLIIQAASPQGPALVLVEAKAHIGEFDRKPKSWGHRDDRDAQARTDANHLQIQRAIAEASSALSRLHAGISISCDHHYQLSNRIAMAWKLASIGIPNALIFLGFTGDREIAAEGEYFADHDHWHDAFSDYLGGTFPMNLLEKDIFLGAASFRLLSRSLPVIRSSRPLAERKACRKGL